MNLLDTMKDSSVVENGVKKLLHVTRSNSSILLIPLSVFLALPLLVVKFVFKLRKIYFLWIGEIEENIADLSVLSSLTAVHY